MIWLLVIPALALALVVGAAARALILTATHRGRHEQREQAAEAEASAFVAELRGLPAPGKDYISDRNVVLPWTPPLADPLGPFTPGPVVWQPSRALTEAELDEAKERFIAAQGKPPIVLADEDDLYDLCAGCRGHDHCDGAVETCCCTCTWGEDWDEEDEDEEPDPFLGETPADERCCECGSLRVTYHNYREQPFCAACANGEGPDPGGHTYDRDIPDWVWLELGKHGPDAAVESIAARAEVAS